MSSTDPRWPHRYRIAVGIVAGALTALLLASTIGLVPGREPVGAGDNGDGSRLYCGVGLSAAEVEETNWKGGVVLDFVRSPACAVPQPSSALVIMKVAAMDQDPFSLTRLGWLYIVMFSTVSGLSAWAVSVKGPAGLWLLLPPTLPLFDSDFSRFLISTFSEPAGLLGAFALLCGVAVMMSTDRTRRVERVLAIGLVGVGGLTAATAKVGYVPVAVVAVALAASLPVRFGSTVRGWTEWILGPIVAALVAAGLMLTVPAALDWQATRYEAVNAHNLIYTVVLAELPGSARHLGLPEQAEEFAGDAYFPNGPAGVAGADLIESDPAHFRNRAWSLLFRSPSSLAKAVGIGLQATRGRSLAYLPSEPWSTASQPPTIGTVISGAQGAESTSLRSWLDAMALPWIPSMLVILGSLAGAASIRWRDRPMSGFCRIAGVAAVCALGISLVAVLGDGYFEIAKHVWLAAYFVDVTFWALLGAAAMTLLSLHRGWYQEKYGSVAM